MKAKIILSEILLTLLSALPGAIVGLFFGAIYGGNYGSESFFGSGFEGAGVIGLILGAAALAITKIYFWLNNVKLSFFTITVLSFLVSSVIAYKLFYLELNYLPGKLIALATILLIPLAGLLIPTYIFRRKMKGKK
ncbi:hypothetical protein HYU08_02130 [Candidatus Woesearchaeota archaeon]|nr:hypothetical protein [Candidatus Woesearchaeota archaeon]